MKLNTQRILTDSAGNPVKHGAEDLTRAGEPWRFGEWIARHLGQSLSVPQGKVTRAAVLSIRLETATGDLALSADDVALIRQVIENAPGMPPWIVGAFRYFLDPDSLPEDERATFAAAYDKPSPGPTFEELYPRAGNTH